MKVLILLRNPLCLGVPVGFLYRQWVPVLDSCNVLKREQGGRVTCVSAGAVFFFVGDFQNNLGDLVLNESINWLSHGSNHLLIALLQLSNRILRLIC